MVLDNVIAFRFLKILDNLIFKQKSLFANNCCSKQNTKSNQTDLFFIFIELSETLKKFVKITLVLEQETLLVSVKHFFIENEAT